MSIDWKARREARRFKPRPHPLDIMCARCNHDIAQHHPTASGRVEQVCHRMIPRPPPDSDKLMPCDCEDFVTPEKSKPQKVISVDSDEENCARCNHLMTHHRDVFSDATRCMLVVDPVHGMKECDCVGFITPDSICTCGHLFSQHDEHDDCCGSWCHCDKFSEAPP